MAKGSLSKAKLPWRKIPCNFEELNLAVTLTGGQSFRWHRTKDDSWQGVLYGYVWSLKQDESGNLLYHVHNHDHGMASKTKLKPGRPATKSSSKTKSSAHSIPNFDRILEDYFRLDVSLSKLFSQWSLADENFKRVSSHYPGVRILRQEPVENLMSFICSSNNNIPRITGMVEKLCSNYGQKIYQEDQTSFYSFPSLEVLAGSHVEGELRSLGFGYRAKYINQAARNIVENHPPGWLESLRRVPYEDAHSALMKLPGVGAKVADCVCLMSLDKLSAIPVDTHVWQITVKDYLPKLKGTKSLTDKIYKQIGDFYRERFGEYAGWANTVLFAADLRYFKESTKNSQDQ